VAYEWLANYTMLCEVRVSDITLVDIHCMRSIEVFLTVFISPLRPIEVIFGIVL
jgi:hypothetical protein